MSSTHTTSGEPTQLRATPPDGFNVVAWRTAADHAVNLTHAEYGVLRRIERAVDWDTGVTRAVSYDELAYVMQMNRRNLVRYVQQLVEKGWLSYAHRGVGVGNANRYRLLVGEHRPTYREQRAQAALVVTTTTNAVQTVALLGLNGGNHYPEKVVTTTPNGGNHYHEKVVTITTPSSSSSNSSSLSSAHRGSNRTATSRTRERERDEVLAQTDFDAFLAAFPNRRARGKGNARDNARDAYADTIAAGIDHRTIMQTLNADPPSPDEWPDKWLHDIASTLASQAKTDAADARRAAIKDCDTCDDYGHVSGHDADGRRWAYICKHGHDSRPAATGTDDAWAEPRW